MPYYVIAEDMTHMDHPRTAFEVHGHIPRFIAMLGEEWNVIWQGVIEHFEVSA